MRASIAAIVSVLLFSGKSIDAQERTPLSKLIIVNTLIGGSVAAITAAIDHRPVGTAALHGSIGGLTVFAGKCIMARGGMAREWIGHEAVAVGSSVIANAGAGRKPFERFVLVVGPVRIYSDYRRHKTYVKLDLLQVGVTAYMATRPGNSLDWHRSIRHSTPVVIDPDADNDLEVAGVIKTWHREEFLSQHELIHVAQEQFITTGLEEPLEGWLLAKIPRGKTIHRFFELGLLAPAWALANSAISRFDRPWESEAESLSERC